MPRITGIYDHYGWWGLEINLQRRWSSWTKTMGQWACDQPKLPFDCSCWTTQMMTCPSNIEDFISASKTWILFGWNTQFRWFGFGLGSQSPNFNDTQLSQLRGEHQAHQTQQQMNVGLRTPKTQGTNSSSQTGQLFELSCIPFSQPRRLRPELVRILNRNLAPW